MSRSRNDNVHLSRHINSLRVINAVLFILLFLAGFAWDRARQNLRVQLPPDLRAGAVINPKDVPEPTVFGFAQVVLQQINHWAKNGQDDYGMQVFRMSPYLTPSFQAQLKADVAFKGKRGELTHRIRRIQPLSGLVYEDRRVDVLSNDSWVVWLDFNIVDTVNGMPVKEITIRYPVRVIRYEVNPNENQWGLALDGYTEEGPKIMTEEQVKSVNAVPKREDQSS